MKKSVVLKDFKNCRWVWLILCAGMLPLFLKGYCMYLLILLLPYAVRSNVATDKPFWVIAAFSVVYFLTNLLLGKNYPPSSIVFDLIYPSMIYLTGVWVVNKSTSPKSVVVLCSAMAMCLAFPAICNNLIDFVRTGKLINVSRIILMDDGITFRSATGYGMMLAVACGCFGIILEKATDRIDRRLRVLFAIFSVLALFSTVHLLNRTGIVLAAVSVAIVILQPPVSAKRIMWTFVALLAAVAVLALVLGGSGLSNLFDLYVSRNMGTGSFASYGGRSERWALAISQLFDQPFGNPEGLWFHDRYNYAHNMWLDAGINGGIFCLVLLVAFTVGMLVAVVRMMKAAYLTRFEKTLMLLVCVAVLLQAFMEPVIEGLGQLFWFFIFYASVVRKMNIKYGISNG